MNRFPSRQDILKRIEKQTARPTLLRELMRALKVSKKDRSAFRDHLQEIVQDGLLIEVKGTRYKLPEKITLVKGRLQCHPDGFGFVLPEKEGDRDLFIGRRQMNDAMHRDQVVAQVQSTKPDGRREGRIIRVLERGMTQWIGRYEQGRKFGFVVPTDKRIGRDLYIEPDQTAGAKDGDLVLAMITAYPTNEKNPAGRIIRVIGKAYDPKLDTEMVMAEFALPLNFPENVLQQSESVPEKVSQKALRGRRDLRSLGTVTIDGETARDFDDAVSIQPLPKGQTRLWVHIADVGHYVPWDSDLDIEARQRGTSVYFPDRVVPMFPERLSNGICSLNPHLDRLTLTAEMVFDSDGRRISYEVYESVINSNERMTYTKIKQILVDRDQELLQRYKDRLEEFRLMEQLCGLLMATRARDGSIDFDLPEPQIILNLQGQPTDIIREERNIAHRLIEEFMLAANRTIAEWMTELKLPFIYRVHDIPDAERVQDFIQFLGSFGHTFRKPRSGKPQPKAFQSVLEAVKGRPEERLINHILLRTMKQARYTTQNTGHFGLAFEHYTHFTSPIRRYPDLIVHRLIKERLQESRITDRHRNKLEKLLPEIAQTSSERERQAMEAEREAVDLKKIRFLSDKEGEEFWGFITGVTAFGFFVELEEMFVEGLVHISSIPDDYYVFMDKQHSLMGRRHRRIFRLADRVKVRVERVDLMKRQADFQLVEEGPQKTARPKVKHRPPAPRKRSRRGKRG